MLLVVVLVDYISSFLFFALLVLCRLLNHSTFTFSYQIIYLNRILHFTPPLTHATV